MTGYTRQTGLFARLDALAAAVGATIDVGGGGPEARSAAVESVTSDSKQARPSDLFAATPGEKIHGAAFTASAIRAGAGAMLTDTQGRDILHRDLGGRSVPALAVDGPRAAVGKAAALIPGKPATDLDSYAVAGTNGKMTTAYMVESILGTLGRKPGFIGAVEIRLAGMSVPAHLMTPISDGLQSYLAFHRRGRRTDVIVETSNHTLVQGRSDPVRFTVAGSTSLAQNHLDFHDTMERYYQVKASFFAPERARNAVVLVGGEYGRRLLAECVPRLERKVVALAVDSGLSGLPDDVVGWRTLAMEGSSFILKSTDRCRLVTNASLPGNFNVVNATLTAVVVITAGHSPDKFARALPAGIDPAVPGRMKMLNARPRVIVDFAHSTKTLVNAMKALRPSTKGRLVVLTGSVGDHDKGKRPAMGAAVTQYDDFVYITDDDPHNENPAITRVAVIEGTCDFDTPVVEVVDRSQTVGAAIAEASGRDTILLAGRGHETTQEATSAPIRLDGRVEARRALRKCAHVHGSEEKA